MRVSTIVKTVNVFRLVFGMLILGTLAITYFAANTNFVDFQQQSRLMEMVQKYEKDAHLQSDLVRQYIIEADEKDLAAYEKLASRVDVRQMMEELTKLSSKKVTALERYLFGISQNAKIINRLERDAIDFTIDGHKEKASAAIFGNHYASVKTNYFNQIEQLQNAVIDTSFGLEQSFVDQIQYLIIGVVILVLLLLIGDIVVSSVVIRTYVVKPVASLVEVLKQFSDGKIDAEVPYVLEKNEIGHLARITSALKNQLLVKQSYTGVLESNREALEKSVADRTAELEKSIKIAEAANEEKSRFLATMSHEIRTPLGGIVGMAELLKRCDLTAKPKYYAKTIHHSADLLLSILGDIIDISKIETGHLELKSQAVNVQESLCEILDVLMIDAYKNGVELILDAQWPVEEHFMLDEVRFKQIILNLVTNAIKFTDEGHVSVSMQTFQKAENAKTFLRIEVEDTGCGISQEQQELVFENFYQVESSSRSASAGTGLGLAICKRLVTKMNGYIGVDSKKGEGAKFWIEIPTQAIPIEKEKELVEELDKLKILSGHRALVVDDLDKAGSLLGAMLTDLGLDCTLVDSGAKALRAVENAGEACRFDLAFIDHSMPSLDGEQTINALKMTIANHHDNDGKNGASGATQIVLTVSHYPSAKLESYAKANNIALLQKPVCLSKLVDCLLEFHEADNEQENSSRVFMKPIRNGLPLNSCEKANDNKVIEVDCEEKPPFILVAEDSLVNQFYIREILNEFGVEIAIEENGVKAFNAYKKRKPDLILMDCMMPEMDGFEATKAIREHEEKTGISAAPIIAVTANAINGQEERCTEVGMNGFIAKPAKRDDLARIVRKYLGDQSSRCSAI